MRALSLPSIRAFVTSLSVYIRKEMSSYSDRTPSPSSAVFMDLAEAAAGAMAGVPMMLTADSATWHKWHTKLHLSFVL